MSHTSSHVATEGFTQSITIGPDGAVWVGEGLPSLDGPRGAVERFDPATLASQLFVISMGSCCFPTAWGADGALYVGGVAGPYGTPGGLHRFDPATGAIGSGASWPSGMFDSLVPASDGGIWMRGWPVGEDDARLLVRFDPATGTFSERSLGLADGHAHIFDIATAPDGAIWASHAGGVTRLDPVTGRRGHWAIPTFGRGDDATGTEGVAIGPDGKLWFVDAVAGAVGSVDLDGDVDRADMDSVLAGGLGSLLPCAGSACRATVSVRLERSGAAAATARASARRGREVARRSVRVRGRGVRPLGVRFSPRARRAIRGEGRRARLQVVLRVRAKGAKRTRTIRRTVVLDRRR